MKTTHFLIAVRIPLALLLTCLILRAEGPLDHWQWRSPLPQGNSLRSVAYGLGAFVAVGDGGTILTSPDGLQWTARTSSTGNVLYNVTFGGGRFVAVGGGGVVVTSTNAVKWLLGNSGTLLPLNA